MSDSVWFKWTGIDELVAQFLTLAHDLTTSAAPDVEGAANTAKATIYAGYPTRTGDLKDHLLVKVSRDDTRTFATVVNTSRHAAVFERGSQVRHTSIGAGRGSMPPNPLFSATMLRTRRGLNINGGPLARVMEGFGLKVSGSA